MDMLATVMPRGGEWQEEKSIDGNMTHTPFWWRSKTRGPFGICSKSIVRVLIIDKSHWDKKGHGFGMESGHRTFPSLHLLVCSIVIAAAVCLVGLSWGLNKIARAECCTRLVLSRHSMKGGFRQWDPVAKCYWFWILKLQLRFQERSCSECRGRNIKLSQKKSSQKSWINGKKPTDTYAYI